MPSFVVVVTEITCPIWDLQYRYDERLKVLGLMNVETEK